MPVVVATEGLTMYPPLLEYLPFAVGLSLLYLAVAHLNRTLWRVNQQVYDRHIAGLQSGKR